MSTNLSTWVESKSTESAVDFVVSTIRKALEDGNLNPGDRLPSETELAGSMSVSRGTIREAMKILDAFGVIEICRGRGTFITKNVDKVSMDPILFSYILTQPSRKELFDFREMLEAAVVKSAIQHATAQDIAELRANQAELKRLQLLPEETARLDVEFHDLLARIVPNRLIRKTYGFALGFFKSSIEKTHKQQYHAEETIQVHEMTIEAIEKRDFSAIPAIVEANNNAWKPKHDKRA